MGIMEKKMETNIMGYILNLNGLNPKAGGRQARIRAHHPSEFNMLFFSVSSLASDLEFVDGSLRSQAWVVAGSEGNEGMDPYRGRISLIVH